MDEFDDSNDLIGECEIEPLNMIEMGEPKIIKRGNAYQAISNNHFKFLDVSAYLAPHTSYVKFLSAMGVEEGKFWFPYEWFTSFEKLQKTASPPYDSDA